MIIVIDAYNLLRAIPPYKKTITDKERFSFIARLGSYGRHKGHKIVIVFDGGPHEWPFKENTKTVQLVYSGIHESADDYIKEYLQAHRAKDLLLVSSDGELNRFAARLGISSIDSAAFYELMRQSSTKQSASPHIKQDQDQLVKMTENSTHDIDEMMLQASKNVPMKSEDFVQDVKQKNKSKKSQSIGKNERALVKKLNKL